MTLRIRDWDKHFENAASRKLTRLSWVPVPNKTDGEGYTALVDHPNGAAHLGAWYAILEVASKQDPRGTLPGGIPHDIGGICRSIGRISRLPPAVFSEVIPRLLEIGWLEKVAESADALADSPNVVAESAERIEQNRIELNGKEQTHTEPPVCVPKPIHSRPPRAADVGQVSMRFDEFCEKYPRISDIDGTGHLWVSHVTVENETAVFAELDRYLASSEVSRGVILASPRYLLEGHRDRWKRKWPAAIANQPERKLTASEQASIEWRKRHGTGTTGISTTH